MLPGFRFLFAAIVLTISILVFGLGAAALLRAAHEEFASNPSWRATPETMFAQRAEAQPVLAMLRVEPPAAEPKASDTIPAIAAVAEPAATVAAAVEPEKIAALKPEEASAPQQAAKPEIPTAESPAQSEAAPIAADAPAAASETRTASTEPVLPPAQALSPASEAVPVAAEQISAPASPDADIAPVKIATLGGPAVTVETTPAKAAAAKPDRSVIKKRLQARRAAQRRRIAARARLAAQAPLQPAGAFAQPFPQPPAAARNH